MEEKIYDRQLNKESLAARLFDEHQIERHFTSAELDQLYDVEALNSVRENNTVSCPVEDQLLASVIQEHESHIWSLNKHDNLLQNKLEEQLSKEDQDKAWACFNEMKQLQKALPKRAQMKAFWSIFQGPPSPEGVSGPLETANLDSVVTCNKKITKLWVQSNLQRARMVRNHCRLRKPRRDTTMIAGKGIENGGEPYNGKLKEP